MPRLRSRYVTLLKGGVGALLIGLLIWQARRNDAFAQLAGGETDWRLLLLGFGVTCAAVVLTFVRWRMVAAAAGIELSIGEAIRFGALGYALTFVGPGAVGGDLYKAVAVARVRGGQRAAAAATVLVDRVLGLVAMLLTATVAIAAFVATDRMPGGAAWLVCQTTVVTTVVAAVGVVLLFVSAPLGDRVAGWLERTEFGGRAVAPVFRSWKQYQQRPDLLAAATGVSLLVDVLLVVSFYCVAAALPLSAPTLVEHFFVVPIYLISAALPITPGGVGVREGVADLMYQGFGVSPGQGTLIAAGHSLTMLLAGGVAVVYYLSRRGKPAPADAAAHPAGS
ncbi:MAG: lysylphosphatidylglycerol synthase transmembrane domain-containing protein [Planctomycetota bacterium]